MLTIKLLKSDNQHFISRKTRQEKKRKATQISDNYQLIILRSFAESLAVLCVKNMLNAVNKTSTPIC